VTEKRSYAPGTPCWVDLASPDVAASVRFYGELFGWEHADAGDPGEAGGYGFFSKRGKQVAGIGPLGGEGVLSSWTTYVSVGDADPAAVRVKEAGGQVLAEPFEVMGAGRMALFVDPTGAYFSVWQPGQTIGAELVNEPGALSWNELNTRDPVAAKTFYAAVFGWDARDREMGEGGTAYTEWLLGRDSIGGMLDMRGRVPDEVPAHWLAYFAVEDCDEALEKTKVLGGSVAVGPVDLPVGRFAVLRDPHGAGFAVFEQVTQGP
jgi:predicted enzyme related to lactoylglutathione lyase